jgi:hypothetical protein
MAADPVTDVLAVFDVFGTGLAWHCMCAVTRLDVPDRLASGPLALPQLAAAVGAHEDSLRRECCGCFLITASSPWTKTRSALPAWAVC